MPDISCRLPSELLPQRFRAIGDALQPDLVAARREGETLHLSFRATPERLRDLADLVLEETQCCPFLSFTLDVEPAPAPIRFVIRGPPEARGLLDAFERAATRPAD